jgi:hypothetical protein
MIHAEISEAERHELEAIRRRADRNAHGHISHALRLQLLDDIATLLTAIGGAIVMAASALLIGAERPNEAVEVVAAVMGSTITLVAVWQAIWQPSKRSRDHQVWSRKFFEIEDSCRLGMSQLAPADVPRLMKDMREVSDDADLIPEHRWRRSRIKASG